MTVLRFGGRPFYRNPWVEFERMQEEMERLTRGLAGGLGLARPTVYPPVNISEDGGHLYVEAEVPGLAPHDLEIALEGETLTIKGERRPPENGGKVSYHRREVEYGRFSRAIDLPVRVDASGVAARCADGVLTIVLPKAASGRPRRIEVAG